MAFLTNAGVERLWAHIVSKLNTKVDKVEGKSLSTEDFTTKEKEKLAAMQGTAGQIVGFDADGNIIVKDDTGNVYVGNDMPTDPSVNVWIKPDGKASSTVMYSPQNLNEDEKNQARLNIDAASQESVELLSEEKADQFTVGDGLTMSEDRVLSVHDDMRVLIDTITVEEDVAEITLNYEPDGTRYNFSSVSLRSTFPACSYSGNIQVVFWVDGDWRKSLTSYFINPYNANGAKVGYAKAWLDDGRWKSGWWNCVNGPGDIANYCENPYFLDRYSVEDGYIRTIKLIHSTAIPAGTIIEVLGVRA